MSSSKTSAATFSLLVIIGLISLKVAVGTLTGSISIFAQAADSLLDLFAVAITFFAVRMATKPADEEHPFGHGKVEDLAAVIQAVLIFTASGLIIYSAVRRIIGGATIALTEVGMGVMLVSIVVSIFLSRYLLRVSRETESIALEANARNIAADVYSAAGVLVGLAAIRFTGLNILDPIIALGVAFIVSKTAYEVLRGSFGGLIDTRLPPSEEAEIKSSILEHHREMVGFHDLRTRKAGSQRYIDLHLVMAKDASLEEAHKICDHIEEDIKVKFPHTTATIHVEPCQEECEICKRGFDSCPPPERK